MKHFFPAMRSLQFSSFHPGVTSRKVFVSCFCSHARVHQAVRRVENPKSCSVVDMSAATCSLKPDIWLHVHDEIKTDSRREDVSSWFVHFRVFEDFITAGGNPFPSFCQSSTCQITIHSFTHKETRKLTLVQSRRC